VVEWVEWVGFDLYGRGREDEAIIKAFYKETKRGHNSFLSFNPRPFGDTPYLFIF